jgi:Glutathione S-transferase, C-terminal domain
MLLRARRLLELSFNNGKTEQEALLLIRRPASHSETNKRAAKPAQPQHPLCWRWTGSVEDPGESLVEFKLRAVADGTELTVTHSGLHEWARLRRPGAVEFAQRRLSALSESLGDKPYLDGERFTAGDLMMTTVLRILKHTDIVTSHKRLAAYVDRCTARPAFKRALDAQIGDFRAAA